MRHYAVHPDVAIDSRMNTAMRKDKAVRDTDELRAHHLLAGVATTYDSPTVKALEQRERTRAARAVLRFSAGLGHREDERADVLAALGLGYGDATPGPAIDPGPPTEPRPEPVPPPPSARTRTTGSAQERRDRYKQLRTGGYSIRQAAWELHIAYDTACRYEKQHREEGQSA